MATYPIRQLADNGGTAQFVPVTAPEAVQFPDGSNLNTFIGSVATIESNPVAANHAVGEFLCVNGQVYEIIDAITAGDSIALGENVQVTNLGSEITALNNGLTQFITCRNVQKTVTIPASGIIYDQTLDVPTVSGYKAFAIGGWHSQGGGYAESPFTKLNLNETAQRIEYAMMTRNPSETTLTIRIKVLYIRSNWVTIPM